MAAADPQLLPFRTYEEYLESQLTVQDVQYVESVEVGRQLVGLGVRGSGAMVRRQEFEARAAAPQK